MLFGSLVWAAVVEMHPVTTGWDLYGRVCLVAGHPRHGPQRGVGTYLSSECLQGSPTVVERTFVQRTLVEQGVLLNRSELA